MRVLLNKRDHKKGCVRFSQNDPQKNPTECIFQNIYSTWTWRIPLFTKVVPEVPFGIHRCCVRTGAADRRCGVDAEYVRELWPSLVQMGTALHAHGWVYCFVPIKFPTLAWCVERQPPRARISSWWFLSWSAWCLWLQYQNIINKSLQVLESNILGSESQCSSLPAVWSCMTQSTDLILNFASIKGETL